MKNNFNEKEEMIKNINVRIEKRNDNNDNKKLIEEIIGNIDLINNNYKGEKDLFLNEINNKLRESENNINQRIIDLTNQINDISRKINKDNVKDDKKNLIYNKDNEINDIDNNIALPNEYINKMKYVFKKEPKKLKYKLEITNTNTTYGLNDKFEIFISYKDNKEYLISPNSNNYNLDIFALVNNKKIISLPGHKNIIRTIRYFINDKNNNEYLISGDDNKIVIIWDITDDYNIKYQIDTKYGDKIYSCLLIFPHNTDNNYIITSTCNKSFNKYNTDKSASKIYSLNNGQFIKYINNTYNSSIFYLLSWFNKKNNNYYIIQFSEKIIINNLLDEGLYSELKQDRKEKYYSGFIYTKDNNDYLCSSSSDGYIDIWDLYNKKIFKSININKCKLGHIIEWNDKYIIVADATNKSFKIIDLEENQVISNIGGLHTNFVFSIKKINHPIYGESLITASNDNTIKLWVI